jgi:hypothetical protein
MAVLYFAISLPLIIFMGAAFSLAPGGKSAMMGMWIAMPIFYTVFGFIFTLIAAWVYNLVAGWIGGIEYTTSEIENS